MEENIPEHLRLVADQGRFISRGFVMLKHPQRSFFIDVGRSDRHGDSYLSARLMVDSEGTYDKWRHTSRSDNSISISHQIQHCGHIRRKEI
jgi:hypothetical protein